MRRARMAALAQAAQMLTDNGQSVLCREKYGKREI